MTDQPQPQPQTHDLQEWINEQHDDHGPTAA
jgi:hypothetical protein